MQMLKAFGWDDEFRDGWNYVPLDFGLLTRDALPGPFAYVLLNVGPYELLCDGLARPLDTWMPKAVYDVKDATSV